MRAVLRIDWRVQCALIAPERAHPFLRVDVGLVIGEEQEGIVSIRFSTMGRNSPSRRGQSAPPPMKSITSRKASFCS